MSIHQAIRATTLASVVNLLLALGSAVVVARLLTPSEIGVFSIAVSFSAFAHVIRDFGVGPYIVKLKEVTRQDMRAGFSVMLLVSWTIAAVMLACASPVAAFYKQPGIRDVFLVLVANFAVLPFGAPILSLLKREMAFDLVAWISIASGAVQAGTTLGCAWAGAGYMSMAWGSLAGNVATVIGLSIARPGSALLMPTFKGLGPVFRFGGITSIASVVGQIGHVGPDLILGKTLSVEAVAQYSRANSPLSMIADKPNEIFIQVFGPAFANGLRTGSNAADMFGRAMTVHSGVQIPLLCVLTLISQPLILFLFGPQWQQAAAMAPWIAAWTILVAPIQLGHSALMAAGKANAFLRASVICNAALVIVLLLSLLGSLEQVAYAMVFFRMATLVAWQAELRRHFEVTWSTLWSGVRPSLSLALVATIPSAVLSWGLGHWMHGISAFWELCCVGGLWGFTYLATLRFGNHPLRLELIRLVPAAKAVLGKKGD